MVAREWTLDHHLMPSVGYYLHCIPEKQVAVSILLMGSRANSQGPHFQLVQEKLSEETKVYRRDVVSDRIKAINLINTNTLTHTSGAPPWHKQKHH